MPEESFKIRIKPDGRIYLRSEELGEERLRLLREMIEDCLGPVVEVEAGDDAPPRPTRIVESQPKHDELRRRG
ncbi:hypothetical protein JW916_03325 [Candidatus Sumerlaeota bacterium]|nr:hypothetical protein [Candidatus Sumerlaeota bacterium]